MANLNTNITICEVDISLAMLLTRDTDGEQHGNGHLEMRPLGGVVTRPNSAGTLTSGEKRATNNENHISTHGRKIQRDEAPKAKKNLAPPTTAILAD